MWLWYSLVYPRCWKFSRTSVVVTKNVLYKFGSINNEFIKSIYVCLDRHNDLEANAVNSDILKSSSSSFTFSSPGFLF